MVDTRRDTDGPLRPDWWINDRIHGKQYKRKIGPNRQLAEPILHDIERQALQQRQMADFERDVKALSLWLAGETEEAIAQEIEVSGKTSVSAILDRYKNGKLSEIVPILFTTHPDDDTAAQ